MVILGSNSQHFLFPAQFVMETWRLMEEKEIGLNNKCYFLMVRALCKGGYLEEVYILENSNFELLCLLNRTINNPFSCVIVNNLFVIAAWL